MDQVHVIYKKRYMGYHFCGMKSVERRNGIPFTSSWCSITDRLLFHNGTRLGSAAKFALKYL